MELDNLIKLREYIAAWLKRCRQATEAAPTVQQLHEVVDWNVRTLERCPLDGTNISTADLDKHAEFIYEQITSSLPMIPAIPLSSITQISSLTASTSSAMLIHVLNVSHLDTPDTVKYATSALDEFRQLQESQQRPDQVRALLVARIPSVLTRFDSARYAFEQYQTGIGNKRAAVFEMRTFLDAVKGEIMACARRHPKEKMTLEIAFERLFSSAPTRTEINEQFVQRPSLMQALSDIGKRRNQSKTYELEALWARVMDYTYIIVSAIK